MKVPIGMGSFSFATLAEEFLNLTLICRIGWLIGCLVCHFLALGCWCLSLSFSSDTDNSGRLQKNHPKWTSSL